MQKMNKEKLLKNIIDQIKEAQIKLGYAKETVRLYYPVAALNTLLETYLKDEIEMLNELKQNFNSNSAINQESYNKNSLGKLGFKIHGGRIEISISPEGVEYVHKNIANSEFLVDIIRLFQNNHSCDIEDICNIFEKYSKDYICEQMPDGTEFDYGIYFEKNNIDEYCYCIKMEMGHTIYHRFTKADYQSLKKN